MVYMKKLNFFMEKYSLKYIMSKSTIKKKQQCSKCTGSGFLKYEPIVCKNCNGSKCMFCKDSGYSRWLYDLCNFCYGDGEIIVKTIK